MSGSESMFLGNYLCRHRDILSRCDDNYFLERYESFVTGLVKYPENQLDPDDINRHAGFFSECQKRYLASKERAANHLLADSMTGYPDRIGDCLSDTFSRNSYRRVEDMSAFIDFSACSRIVIVGCGAFPATLFWMHDHFPDIDYIGLDIDGECVSLAAKLTKKLGRKNLRFLTADGSDFDFRSADFVFVANHVVSKGAVLRQLAHHAGPRFQLVVREPTRLGQLFSETVLSDLPKGFVIRGSGKESNAFLSYNLVLSMRAGR